MKAHMSSPASPAGVIWLAAVLLPGIAVAAPINYGDFSDVPPGSVMYTDVTETANSPGDDEPLYGAPSITRNRLDFDPRGFSAVAVAGGGDLTDGQLNLTMGARPDYFLQNLFIGGSGDATLFGSGGSSATVAQVGYGLSLASITVLEVDEVTLPTPVLLTPASISGALTLVDNPGQLMSWDIGLNYDIGFALSQAGVSFIDGATKIEIALDSSLSAISDPSSIAYLAQKDFFLEVTAPEIANGPVLIPEPSSLLSLSLAAGLLLRRRRA